MDLQKEKLRSHNELHEKVMATNHPEKKHKDEYTFASHLEKAIAVKGERSWVTLQYILHKQSLT